jgi:ElaB/YqjD/DUF883 family membrane-anchored ribosome-binding protein
LLYRLERDEKQFRREPRAGKTSGANMGVADPQTYPLPESALKEVAMSAKVDQFCDTLRDRLNAIEGRLQSVMADVKALPDKAEKVLRDKLEEARTKLEVERERVEQTRANLKARVQQKLAETKEVIREWKAKGEKRKLQARADWAEAYAADAIYNAMASVDEAEEAILNALVARMDADAAR